VASSPQQRSVLRSCCSGISTTMSKTCVALVSPPPATTKMSALLSATHQVFLVFRIPAIQDSSRHKTPQILFAKEPCQKQGSFTKEPYQFCITCSLPSLCHADKCRRSSFCKRALRILYQVLLSFSLPYRQMHLFFAQ